MQGSCCDKSYGYAIEDVEIFWGNKPVIDYPAELNLQHLDTISAFSFEQIACDSFMQPSLTIWLMQNIYYFIIQTYLPCIPIVMLLYVSFWINHKATSAQVALDWGNHWTAGCAIVSYIISTTVQQSSILFQRNELS